MRDPVAATLRFVVRETMERARRDGPRLLDLRGPAAPTLLPTEAVTCAIQDARRAGDVGLERSGFEVFRRPSAVRDWYDSEEVLATYYGECRSLAAEITGASHTFTYDHLIREPDRQIAGGGLGAPGEITGPERGGGYVGGVHMDYVDGATWVEYH